MIFRLNQILWKLHWEKGILEWKRHRKSIYQSNDNAAVEVSPAMENLRIERGSVGDHYTSLQRLQKRKKMRKL